MDSVTKKPSSPKELNKESSNINEVKSVNVNTTQQLTSVSSDNNLCNNNSENQGRKRQLDSSISISQNGNQTSKDSFTNKNKKCVGKSDDKSNFKEERFSDDSTAEEEKEVYSLLVSNIPYQWTCEQISDYIQEHCVEVYALEQLEGGDPDSGQTIRLLFLNFEKCNQARKRLKLKAVEGRKLNVNFSVPADSDSDADTENNVLLVKRGGRGRARSRGRGRGVHAGGDGGHADAGGDGAHAHTGGARTHRGPTSGAGRTERPSAVDPFYCGMVGELPVGQPLERPLTQRRSRVLAAARRGPVPVSLWSSMDLLTGNHPTQQQSPQEDRAAAAQPAVVDMELCSVPSLALRKLGGSGASTLNLTPTSRKRNASDHHDIGAKRRLITSSSSSSRPLRDNEISNALNYGSDEDSEEDGEDEIGPQYTIVPRVVQMYATSEYEGEGGEVDAFVSFSWPPTSNDHPPVPNSSGPIPSTSHVPDYSVPPSLPTHTPSSPSCPMSEPGNKFDFKWRGFPQPQTPPELRREPFSQINCGPTVPYASPYDAFTAIWDRDIMEHIAMETNRYAQQLATVMLVDGSLCPSSRITKWKDTDVSELHVYFAIILATGIVVKSRLEEYWNSTLDIFSTPGFTAAMRYDRFVLLSKCLHFQDNDGCDPELMTRAQAKLFKVQPILDHLNNKFQQLYVLGQNVALDESLTMWKGWLDINQFIRNKAAAVGIKTYEVCESQTGYLWRFEVHAGHDTSSDPQEDSPVSGKVPALVLRLLNGLEHKGHTIWMDNFYNSPALARELKVRGFDCVGTLRTNRQFVPIELTNLAKNDMAIGQVNGCTSGDVDLIVYRDKNRVAFVSTYHGLATAMCGDTHKPTVIPDYNVCMGGVDRKDQMLAMYPIERRRNKIWYKKFFRKLLNASVLNAYILHKAHRSISHRNFRQTLVRELLAAHTPPAPTRALPNTWHFPGQYDLLPGTTRNEHQRRSCSVCKKRTSSFCKACNVPLCVFGCFESYHTLQ